MTTPHSLVDKYAHNLRIKILDPTTCPRLKAKYVQEARMIHIRSGLPVPKWVTEKLAQDNEAKITGEIADKLRLFGVEEKDIRTLFAVADDYMLAKIRKLGLRDLRDIKDMSYKEFCSHYLGLKI